MGQETGPTGLLQALQEENARLQADFHEIEGRLIRQAGAHAADNLTLRYQLRQMEQERDEARLEAVWKNNKVAALEAELATMRKALIRLLGELSCCYACDGPDRNSEDLVHNPNCYVAAVLEVSK